MPPAPHKFIFIGVSTQHSTIQMLFPIWAEVLGNPQVVLEGIDLKIHDQRSAYEDAVSRIRYDPDVIGGLVTAHKVDLYRSAGGLFDFLDPYARMCGEVSNIIKQEGQLMGYCMDPVYAGLSLDEMLPPDYFGSTGAYVLCFGAGGTARAILVHLVEAATANPPPAKVIMVERLPDRLQEIEDLIAQLGTSIQVELVQNEDPQTNDRLMASLPDHSLVINATGMGKDAPGSPLTGAGLFPRDGIAWEINYRGELDFKHQALSQEEIRALRVEDGWRYFLHGWSLTLAQAFHVDLTPTLFDHLDHLARPFAPSGPP